MAVARAESTLAIGTVIIGPLQVQRAQYTFKRLPVTAMILDKPSAGAGQFRPGVIGGVSVEPLFQRSGGQTQSLPPHRYLHSFEIQIPDRLSSSLTFSTRSSGACTLDSKLSSWVLAETDALRSCSAWIRIP